MEKKLKILSIDGIVLLFIKVNYKYKWQKCGERIMKLVN